MATITVTIKDRIATVPSGVSLVCNNPSDVIQFNFDSEWSTITLKTARFSWQRSYVDVPFSGNIVNVPDISKTNVVELGVYADGIATTAVKIPFKHSIKSIGGSVAEPTTDVYSQIVQTISKKIARFFQAILFLKREIIAPKKCLFPAVCVI